jgi:hypothetical protein
MPRPTTAAAFREPAACEMRRGLRIPNTVTVELADSTWVEFHATNPDNARRMAELAVRLLGARGATCWEVKPEGGLARRPFYEFYAGVHDEAIVVNRPFTTPDEGPAR